MSATRPATVIGFRRRHRVSGEPYLTATVGEDLHVPAGSTLDLRRMHDGTHDGPEFALLIVLPREPWNPTRTERECVARDRLDGSGIRRDPRDQQHHDANPL